MVQGRAWRKKCKGSGAWPGNESAHAVRAVSIRSPTPPPLCRDTCQTFSKCVPLFALVCWAPAA
eukprot:759604-Hanusia_phi.AAC.1